LSYQKQTTMGRPKAVNIKTFPQYNLLHTERVKMICGVTMTALYPIKETTNFFISIEVWSHMCSKFKRKKDGFTLNLDIPILTNETAVKFLERHCWSDWVDEELKRKNSDTIETLKYLDKVFPEKKKVYFHELDSILGAYSGGTFISFDDNGEVRKPSEQGLNNRKYYSNKYNHDVDSLNLKAIRDRWVAETDEDMKTKYLTEYTNAKRDSSYANNCLDSVFIELGKHGVGYPVAFTEGTAEWAIEKYGKKIAYAHAGEIYFVATADTVYFESKRHF
jgi:hypothetical protein